MIKKIKKRDGTVVDFDQQKITKAIWKAAESVGGKDIDMAKKLSDKVVAILEYQFSDKEVPSVEETQDIVEKVEEKRGFFATLADKIGFLDLDIDGYDYFVLETLLSKHKPKLISCETNEKIPVLDWHFNCLECIVYA